MFSLPSNPFVYSAQYICSHVHAHLFLVVIKFLGFKDESELAFEDNVKHSFFIYPDEMVHFVKNPLSFTLKGCRVSRRVCRVRGMSVKCDVCTRGNHYLSRESL